jgi:outer membrane protein
LNAEQADVIDRIGRKMVDVLDRFARENGYITVLDTSSQGQVVVYASAQIDITQDIIRLYDQAYPVKGAVPTAQPRPPAPKPSAPAQQKPTAPAQQKPPQQ